MMWKTPRHLTLRPQTIQVASNGAQASILPQKKIDYYSKKQEEVTIFQQPCVPFHQDDEGTLQSPLKTICQISGTCLILILFLFFNKFAAKGYFGWFIVSCFSSSLKAGNVTKICWDFFF